MAIPLAAGIALALGLGAFASVAGFDRDRAFYPTLLMVVGHYYLLFALLGAAPAVAAWETAGLLLFAAIAVAGFRTSLWLVAAGLAAHGLFDAVHPHLIDNGGMPAWWPAFCGAFDITAAAFLALRLRRRRAARPAPVPA